jgi:hypothetical protein
MMERSAGLGDDLMAELDTSFAAIEGYPGAWPLWPHAPELQPPLRRYLLTRFRYYAIAYQLFEPEVLVLAIVHASRRPFYWIERTEPT